MYIVNLKRIIGIIYTMNLMQYLYKIILLMISTYEKNRSAHNKNEIFTAKTHTSLEGCR